MSSATAKSKKSKKKKKSPLTARSLRKQFDRISRSDSVGEIAFEEWRSFLAQRDRAKKTSKILGGSVIAALNWMIEASQIASLPLASWLSKTAAQARVAKAGEKRKGSGKSKKKSTGSKRSADASISAFVSDGVAEQWLVSLGDTESVGNVGLEALAWCHALVAGSESFSREIWLAVFESLCEISETRSGAENAQGNALGKQWIDAELPITMAWQFPELDPCRKLADAAAQRMSKSILALLDGEGMVHGSEFESFSGLVASWLRCLAMLKEIRGVSVSSDAFEQFEWTVRNLLRLVSNDGRLAFAHIGVTTEKTEKTEKTVEKLAVDLRELIRAALRLTEDEDDIAVAKLRLDGKKIPKSRVPDEPSYHSEWSGIAILQSSWDRGASRLVVDYSDLSMRVELTCADERVFSTDWSSDVLIDGVRLEADASAEGWEEVCWFADEDADYLELELELSQGWIVQRQFLLARHDRFLMTSDHLVQCASEPSDSIPRIDYRLDLPLAEGVRALSQGDGRECLIKSRRELAMAYPLALPEWSSDPRHGDLHLQENEMQLHQVGQGRGMSTPLFFDLNPERLRAPRTWRSLTVAEKRRIVARDEAVGYRIQAGLEQWMMYRSLVKPENRTLIGQNLSSEFLFARLSVDGDAKTIVEIE